MTLSCQASLTKKITIWRESTKADSRGRKCSLECHWKGITEMSQQIKGRPVWYHTENMDIFLIYMFVYDVVYSANTYVFILVKKIWFTYIYIFTHAEITRMKLFKFTMMGGLFTVCMFTVPVFPYLWEACSCQASFVLNALLCKSIQPSDACLSESFPGGRWKFQGVPFVTWAIGAWHLHQEISGT